MQGGSWHAKRREQLGAGTVPLPHVIPGQQVDVLRSHLHREDGPVPVLAAAGSAPVTVRCPASPAGSAPQPVSWRCRGPCLRAGKGCSADLHWEKARRLAELRLPAPAKAGTQSPTTAQESPSLGTRMLRRSPTCCTQRGAAATNNQPMGPCPSALSVPSTVPWDWG